MNMFIVDKDCEKPGKEKTETFHNLVANILFPTKRARLDTGTDVSYLTTRVREIDQSYWMKMVHLFKYFRGTKYLPLILIEVKSRMLKLYVDG